jgi:group II intron reverse transcriptase/maturase
VSPELERIGQLAQADPKLRFTALAHHLDEEFLRETWQGLNKRGAAGVDGVRMEAYGENLEENLKDLVQRLKAHSYQAPNVRRTYIPKAGNPAKLRPLGIPTVEDRLLQAAVSRLLAPIYEADFLECSYGFRPGRTAHQALAEVRLAVIKGEAQWVADADIKGFFDHLDHAWLMRMLERRIGDPWILRLIRKWLKAGILDQGTVTTPAEGTPQGGPLSPMLANVYLHYVLDLWFTRVVRPHCRGAAKLVRFADDYVALFALQQDADQFAAVLPERLAKFGLTLAEEKTKLIPFGRRHWIPGQSHEHFFDLLGFRHHLGTNRHGRMTVVRIPCPKSVRKFLSGVREWLQRHFHNRPSEQQRVLAQKLRGFYQYFALYHTLPKLGAVRNAVRLLWRTALRRRSQRSRLTWEEWQRKPWFELPQPKLIHRTV